jgi:hypothetical protein
LINKYLIDKKGIDNYMKLFMEMSGNRDYINSVSTDYINQKLILNELCTELISAYKYEGCVEFDKDVKDKLFKLIYKGQNGEVYGNNEYLYFKLISSVFIKNIDPVSDYKSKLFEELFPDRKYNGENYFIEFDTIQIKLYNFITNEITASFDKGFMLAKKEINREFFISRKLIPLNVETITVSD